MPRDPVVTPSPPTIAAHGAASASGRLRTALRELDALDRASYVAVADTGTPTIDNALRRLSHAADHSVLWFTIAAVHALTGGRAGRRAALRGVAAIGTASLLINQVAKPAMRRRRPERSSTGVVARHVRMPQSASFPSGHSASAFAFANAMAATQPLVGLPLRLLAGSVAYSRVHTGVHYPGDVVVGAILGAVVGDMVTACANRAARATRGASDG